MLIPSTPDGVDVVLPLPRRGGGLPWCSADSAGLASVVVDNGSTDGSAGIARARRHRRRGAAARFRAPPATQGRPATAVVCFCDCDASLDPALLVPFVDGCAAARLVWCSGGVGRGRGAWRTRPGGNVALACCCAGARACGCATSGPLRGLRRSGRRADLGLSDRRSGYPLQMVVRAATTQWRVTWHDVRTYRAPALKVTGTRWRDLAGVRDMGSGAGRAAPRAPVARRTPSRKPSVTTLLVIARNHGPAGEDPAHPPFTPSRRRRSPRQPSRAAGGGRDPARRGSWCWTGGPGRSCRPASRSSRSARAVWTSGSPPPSPAAPGPPADQHGHPPR